MNRQPVTDAASLPSTDGRTARRDRGRTAALEAALELFEEENLEPTPEQIALRAGISTRSVYRYFRDRDELVRAIIAHKQMQVLPLFQIENIGQGDLDVRIVRFVDSRLKVYDAIGATARAMAIKAASDPVISEQIAFRKGLFREQLETHFANEFNQMTTKVRAISLNAIDALTQVESIERYRIDLQLPANECRSLLVPAIRALLTLTS